MTTLGVYFNVKNAEKSIAFYEGLGFQKVGEPDRAENGDIQVQRLRLGDAGFALGQISANDDPDFRKWVSGPLGAGVLTMFFVDDVNTFKTKGEAIGAEVHTETDPEGGTMVEVVDPDGYALWFMPPDSM